jgi:hypothetical protein
MSNPPVSLSPLPAEPEAAQSIPSWRRIPGAIYEPGPTFADIARAPHYMLCLGLEILIAVLSTWEIVHRIGAVNMARMAIQNNPAAANLSAQQIARQSAVAAKFISFSPLIAIFGALVVVLVVAAVMLGAANFGLGLQTRFKQMFSLTVHAMLPLSLAYILGLIVVALARHPSHLNAQNLLGSNLGYFLSSTSPKWLQVLGGRLDLFSFWVIALLALGISKAGPRVKYTSALTWVGLLWLLYVLAATGIAAI